MKLIQHQHRPHGGEEDGLWEQPWPLPRRGPPEVRDDQEDPGLSEPEEDVNLLLL